MPRITPIPWQKFERFLLISGCRFKREKGNHRIYWRADLKRPIIIPREKQLPIFVIRNNLRVLGMSPEDYLDIVGGA